MGEVMSDGGGFRVQVEYGMDRYGVMVDGGMLVGQLRGLVGEKIGCE